MSEQALKNLALAIQQNPEEIKATLKRNGVFTPDNADLPTLNKMTLAALGSSEAFRKDMQAWAKSKAGSYSNVVGGDPVLDSTTTGGTTDGKPNYGDLWKFLGDTTVALINYKTAREQNQALLAMNDAQGGSSGNNDGVPATTQGGGISTTKILLVVALVGVVGGTIYYFTRK
jgi:hypothetical protein